MSPENDCAPRKVWVLLFDQLQIENTAQRKALPSDDLVSLESRDSEFSPFDDLDLQSTCFEQYLLQDTRDSVVTTSIPGTLDALKRFAVELRASKNSASHVRLVCVGERADRVRSASLNASLLTSPITSTRLIERTLCIPDEACDGFDEAEFRHDVELQSELTGDLVWIDAWIEAAEDQKGAADKLLKLVQTLRSEAIPTSSGLPVLIVSAMRGDSREVGEPFISGLSESRVHVPLWIDHGAGHACRIQALAGSNDLLPTLSEYLTGKGASPGNTASVREHRPDQVVQFCSRPTSLVSVCERHTSLPDRLLRITGDSWDALRTQQYLLVRFSLKPQEPDSAQPLQREEKTTRRLYLKPDDVWNVNDAIVSYAAIADQMERMAAEIE